MDSRWGNFQYAGIPAAQKTDRVLQSSKLEDCIYRDLSRDDENLEAIQQEAAPKLHSFPALSRDIFQSFYSLFPKRTDADRLTAEAQKFNAKLLDHVGKQVAFRFRLTLQDSVHNRHCLRTDKLGQCQRNGIIEHFHSVRIPRSTAAGLKHLRYLRCLPVQAQARHLNRYASDPHCRLAAAQVLILSDIQSSED